MYQISYNEKNDSSLYECEACKKYYVIDWGKEDMIH